MRSDVQKKTAHASEQDRPDVKARREAWLESQLDLDPERLVFIDETWTTTNMARKCGREQKGERLRASVPHGHWKTTTFIGGLRCDRMTAPMVLDGPVNGQWFQAYVDQVLVPTLSRDDIVIMDMYGRPRRCKKNLRSCAAHGQVLTCIRPLMRRSHMPRARMGVRGSDPLQSRALVALVHELVFPIPSRRPLRHTLRLTFLRRRQPSR
ncbi:transposase, partial [Methylocystis sp. H62]|nr:transposase [Methylocystis sp. H62]